MQVSVGLLPPNDLANQQNARQVTRVPHYATLDKLRGVAILMVMLIHFFPSGSFADRELSPWIRGTVQLIECGWIGVDLFFVLSGFLITGILLSTKASPHYFRNFYARRGLRIFPLYYLLLVGVLFGTTFFSAQLAKLDPALTQGILRYQWTFWLYGSNIATTFDSTARFWVWLAPIRLLPWVCGGVIVQSWALTCVFVSCGNLDGAYEFTLCRIGAMAFGAWLAWFIHRGTTLKQLRLPLNAGMIGSGMGLAFLFITRGGLPYYDPIVLAIGLPLISLFSVSLIGKLVLSEREQISEVHSPSILSYLGKYSYSMYLFHVPLVPCVRYLCKNVGFGLNEHAQLVKGLMEVGIGVLATLIVALITWKFIELPTSRWKKYFSTIGDQSTS
jgi:peptidoglycan/LPS O-acetylase OafA/YrhL